MTENKVKVIISNAQKEVKIPTGVRMLVRRCCTAVLIIGKSLKARRRSALNL